MKVLVLNCGSSSIKYKLFDMDHKEVIAQGGIEKIGLKGSFLKLTLPDGGKKILEKDIPEHTVGVEFILNTLISPEYGAIKSLDEINAVGHRMVHGGEKFSKSVLITPEVEEMVKECYDLAPLHNPANITGINACRAVIRSYILEIDSLNRLNQNLTAENTRVKGQYAEATRQIEGLNADKQSLSEKVAIAAQLDATGISLTAKNKRGKVTKSLKKCKTLQVNFSIAKNVTAQSGMKTIYVRITTPTGSVLTNGGTFNYENRSLQYSMKRDIEYTGNETAVTTYWNVNEFLSNGTYNVSIFADGNMIGSRNFSFK